MVKKYKDFLVATPTPESNLQRINYPRFDFLYTPTGQPDFADLKISYLPNGKKLSEESLIKYLASFRNDSYYHEEAINLIADDLKEVLQPKKLQLTADFLVRGGITSSIRINE